MNNSTISRKVFIRIIPTMLLTIAAIGGLAFYSAKKEINNVYDAQLISNANVLWALLADELKEAEEGKPKKIEDIDLTIGNQMALNNSADEYADSRMFRVWKKEKIMVYSDTALPDSIGKKPSGFSISSYKGERWRIYNLPITDSDVSIEVGEKISLRYTLVNNILVNIALPLLLLVPVIGLLIWFGIASGLDMIRSLVEQIRKRSPDDLAHVNTEELPKDLAPLGKSINQLFTQLEQSFTAEKRFTDHAAHQLRTPLATIKLQLQMLETATNEDEKKSLLLELNQSIERATKLVSMLLTSARLSHQNVTLRQFAAYSAIAAVMADFGLLAKEKHIEMSLQGAEDTLILADEILFKLMMSNLIENAVKYTGENGSIDVRIEPLAHMQKISITDTGCGIPEAEREMVFERFYRIDNPKEQGSGLGLAIVAGVIKRLSGDIFLKNPQSGKGLLVEIILPAK